MSKRIIQSIIILMSISLLGITIIQYVWLKRGIEVNAENFDDKVIFALNRVKHQIEEDANDVETFNNLYKQNRGSSIFKLDIDPADQAISPLDRYRADRLKDQIGSTAWFIEPSVALYSVDIADVEKYLNTELQDQDIDLDYDYGIYSNKDSVFVIANGSYTVSVDNEEQFSEGGEADALYESAYQVNLFSIGDTETAGSLRIFFPKRGTFLFSAILPSLISSILFTGLILFCFIYTINIILTQKKVSQMKTDFINNMTHEFKTPIATISLAADSINNPMIMSRPEQIKRYAGIIKEENSRMLTQVEKVLQIAKLDKEDFELKVTDIDVNELAKSAVEMTALKVNDRGGTVKALIQSTKPMIKGDENHVSNVIHNLLDNANKYSPDKPNITLETKDVNNGIEIIVSDEGIGMSKEDLKRIFEKFYRVSTGNIHDVKGFGLGLSYVKAIVDAHKGRVSVRSELGKGSVFTVFLPTNFVTKD